jgi:integrase
VFIWAIIIIVHELIIILWRLIAALARFGGLRCPSEVLALEWRWIDWAGYRFTVFSPKQEHLPGRGMRVVPLFPELRPYLEEAFELAETGAVHVITRYREGCKNLRTQFQRIIRKAGVTPWQRLFHNLRSSRQTELTEIFPAHVVASWLGNSVRVATQHYLQTTEEHFQRGAQCGALRAQNPAQQPAALAGTVLYEATQTTPLAGLCESGQLDANSCCIAEYPRQGLNRFP